MADKIKTITFEGVNFNVDALGKTKRADFVAQGLTEKHWSGKAKADRETLLADAWKEIRKAAGSTDEEIEADANAPATPSAVATEAGTIATNESVAGPVGKQEGTTEAPASTGARGKKS